MKTGILEKYRLLIQAIVILMLLGLGYFLYYFYTKLNVKDCGDGTVLSGGICMIGIGILSESGLSLYSGSTTTTDIYGTHYLDLGGTYSRYHDISKFKKIKINENVDGLRIFITVDFPNWFKDGYSSYTTSQGFKFALKYFLGEKGFDEEGGYYNVLWDKNCTHLINDTPKGLIGAVVGKDISGGHQRIIDITDQVPIATEKCSPGVQFTHTNSIGFINNNIGKELYVGGYLSHVGEGGGHGPIKGWEVSLIKEIKIEYIGNSGAIELVE